MKRNETFKSNIRLTFIDDLPDFSSQFIGHEAHDGEDNKAGKNTGATIQRRDQDGVTDRKENKNICEAFVGNISMEKQAKKGQQGWNLKKKILYISLPKYI